MTKILEIFKQYVEKDKLRILLCNIKINMWSQNGITCLNCIFSLKVMKTLVKSAKSKKSVLSRGTERSILSGS